MSGRAEKGASVGNILYDMCLRAVDTLKLAASKRRDQLSAGITTTRADRQINPDRQAVVHSLFTSGLTVHLQVATSQLTSTTTTATASVLASAPTLVNSRPAALSPSCV